MTSARPHIAVDARMLRDMGIGTYLSQLLPRVARLRRDWRLTLIGKAEDFRNASELASLPNVATRECTARYYSIREQLELPARAPGDADLFWSPLYNIPLLWRGRLLVTVHDLCHLALPELTGGWLKQRYARLFFDAVRRRASGILFPSEFTRREFARLLGHTSAHTAVTPEGVDDSWQRLAAEPEGVGTGAPYLLYVGNVKRHKNVGQLVRAFARIRDRIPHDLYIVGRMSGLTLDSSVQRDATGLGARVRFTGEVDSSTLRQYVLGAAVLVNPSIYEGFGLPPLEAMAVGCPVIVARAGALPEVCGDAALYVEPHDDAGLAERLLDVLGNADLRRDLARRGLARAAGYSWDACAVATVTLMERVLFSRTAFETRQERGTGESVRRMDQFLTSKVRSTS